MSTRVLLVEPDAAALESLRQAIGIGAQGDALTNFPTARTQLLSKPYDILVTNLRLHAYNGLHLVYLAQAASRPARSVVYTDKREPLIGREVQQAGAFYELRETVPYTLQGYVRSVLPPADRRDPSAADRRRSFRGGRRCADIPVVATLLGIPIHRLDTV